MGRYLLDRSQVLPYAREEVFPFFADARNLEAITPSFMRFRIATPDPIEMRQGTIIEYQLRIYGVPQRWRTRITFWQPPERFADLQEKGPYRYWLHTHSFETLGAGGTLMRDRVEYELPFGLLGRLAHALFVRRTLEAIFDYRRQHLPALLAERLAPTS